MAFDKDIPAASTSLRSSNPQILANQSAVETALDQDHDFTTGSTQTGRHNKCTFIEAADLGTGAAGVPILGAQTANGKAELVFTDEDDNDVQLTKAGDLNASANLNVVGTTAAGGTITLAANADLVGSSTSDITINTNKFTVAGATGNTVIAGTASVGGTLDVTGNIDPTSYETTNGGFKDEDNMASDSASAVSSQQAIKAYVDNHVIGTRATDDDDTNAMIAAHAYLANQDGYVNVAFTVAVAQGTACSCRLFVDTDTDPATGGNMVDRYEDTNYHDTNTKGGLGAVPVKSGDYFEVTASNVTVVAIYWTPAHGTLVKCTDQD